MIEILVLYATMQSVPELDRINPEQMEAIELGPLVETYVKIKLQRQHVARSIPSPNSHISSGLSPHSRRLGES